ncbi:MAG: TIGR03089 family protein [Actinobacteria bacterium]|nr:TIGR03089 family protein [Actinomycetota bacterium]
MTIPSGPEQLFADRLAADPGSPLVTFYDDATGERAELSAKSLGNWVAKTHFLLLDELGTGPGDRAFVRLPVHWLAAPVLLGCWFAGLEVVADPAGASVAFGDADSLRAALPDPDRLDGAFAVSQRMMAMPDTPPAGMADYSGAVRPMPDSWQAVRAQAGPDDPALAGLTRAGLAQEAAEAARELELQAGGRLLWSTPFSGPRDWIAALLAPLAVGGSVVLVRNPDPAKAASRAMSEKVSISH